ncbi:MAG: pyruvate dehydrogenase complex dihydrolipoamide acetyltransferase [Chlamydiae bacterium]|nr:pyruvate dehydrogenase complex dihydrolipoamide acetyltransferase [Chlamydiota bacterium]
MPFTLTMPKLSPTMEEGTITKWRKKVGDQVKVGDVLFEVATDKATVEHTALDAGFLRKIIVEEGKEASVNQAVAIFTEKSDESIEGYVPEGIAQQAKETPKVEEKVSSETAVESRPQEVKPAAASMTQPSFVPEPPLASYVFSSDSTRQGRLIASPLAKKLANEKGLDISTAKGSGPNGRILSRDIASAQPAALVAFSSKGQPTVAPGTYEEIPLSPMRKVVGQRLQQSKSFIPHFYVSQEILADQMIAVRDQLKVIGHKITFNDIVLRAVALSLREHPEMNSGFNSVTSSIIRFKTIDISVAVSVPAGLITPIVRHADYKNLGELSAEVKTLAQRAKEGKLNREEYVGGSFTISNLGMFGVSGFTGVINPPQAGILCIGGIEDKPVVKNGQVVPGKVMTVTLSADHRVVDGADGAKFIKTLQKYLENPATLLI